MTFPYKKILRVLGFAVILFIGFLLEVAVLVRTFPPAKRLADTLWIDYLNYSLEHQNDAYIAAATKDTVGGKTPEETLRLYIEAVDRGDYKLASKYFVIEGQEKELEALSRFKGSKVAAIQNLLKQTLSSKGEFSINHLEFFIDRPIFVHLIKYPSGNWKILEI